ncbi:MAG: ATP-binding protein [Propionicimonas sp.]|uniref:sensor histidine kinase n=1 Tax=Propionicimonas sp. TaxID=1955623 RepID=UPI003D0A9F05
MTVTEDPDDVASPAGSLAARVAARVDPFLESWFDPDAVAIRQVPFTVAFLTSFVLTLAMVPERAPWMWVGLALVLLVQLAGVVVPWQRFRPSAQMVLPLVQMLSLVLLELGSSTVRTYFTALVFIPVVSLALQRSLWGVVLGTAGAYGATQAIALFRGENEWDVAVTRTVVVPITALLVGLTVYGVTNRLRSRTRALQALRREQDATLEQVRRNRDELQSMAEQLRSTSELMSGLVDAARLHAVVAVEPDGRISVFNKGAASMLGYTAEEARGMRVFDLYDPDELDAAVRDHRASSDASGRLATVVGEAADGGTSVREWHLRRRDAETVPCQVVVTMRPAQLDGTPSGYLLVATDNTERRESDRLQDEFVGLVSHELRTPLTGILGYVELLRLGGGLGEEQLSDLEVIERNAKRLQRLVSDLLLSVQLSAGTFGLLSDEVDLSAVARSCAATIASSADVAGVDLVLECDEEVPVYGDAVRLAQVVDNLLSNAVKFTPAGGTVRMRTRPGGPAEARLAVVEVSDTGIGISPDEVDRLTERFYRARSARGKRIRGIGLGLSITQAIIDAHHGRMDVRSALGAGTTFTVSIPIVPPS